MSLALIKSGVDTLIDNVKKEYDNAPKWPKQFSQTNQLILDNTLEQLSIMKRNVEVYELQLKN